MTRAAVLALILAAGPAAAQDLNDFPTNARAEYVFTCMAVNGQNQDVLNRCSCAIDQIATVLPYDKYVGAETILRMQQVTGEKAGMFKSMPQMEAQLADLRRAEAEAEILCF